MHGEQLLLYYSRVPIQWTFQLTIVYFLSAVYLHYIRCLFTFLDVFCCCLFTFFFSCLFTLCILFVYILLAVYLYFCQLHCKIKRRVLVYQIGTLLYQVFWPTQAFCLVPILLFSLKSGYKSSKVKTFRSNKQKIRPFLDEVLENQTQFTKKQKIRSISDKCELNMARFQACILPSNESI